MNEKARWRYRQGARHERERIIALIRAEEERAPYRDFHPDEIIALIKGTSHGND